MSSKKKVPATVYIDGFNMYHAIEDIKDSVIKWVNYAKMAESFLRRSERLHKTYLFTSLTPWDAGKKQRHEAFMAAQRAYNVEVIEARFKKNRRHCRTQNRRCKFWEEKENDVAIAVQMIADAVAGQTERIILVTADTDQIPAIKYLRANFPSIELALFIPPNRKNEARELGDLFVRPPVEIDIGRLRACLLPAAIPIKGGNFIQRPDSYAPLDAAPHPSRA